ncbi:MAG: hypothetical protein LBP22_06720 [Deltaproteobacteria bacterium]|jgi:hypothetical protein|nr:hypothetical protein [Deltaproteobacteria bacterium]
MTDRTRKIRFRKKKSYKGWFIPVILVALIFGIRYFWPKSIGPVSSVGGQSATVSRTETAEPNQSPPDGIVSVRQVLEKVLGLWSSALSSGSYNQFYSIISSEWQKQDTPQRLAQAYGPLRPHKDLMEFFPRRGKLVVLQSGPLESGQSQSPAVIRDTLGPESPWLVRGEWRTGRSALGFSLNLVWESGQWKPAGLRVEVFKSEIRNQ